MYEDAEEREAFVGFTLPVGPHALGEEAALLEVPETHHMATPAVWQHQESSCMAAKWRPGAGEPPLPGPEQEQLREWALGQWRASKTKAWTTSLLLKLSGQMRTPAAPGDLTTAAPGLDRSSPPPPGLPVQFATGMPEDGRAKLDELSEAAASTQDSSMHDLFDSASATATLPTTLMMLNIPVACTSNILLREWFVDGQWDFLYLPMYSGGKRALGYAFVNFTSGSHAAAFYARWQGCFLPEFRKGRPLNITVAEMQGFDANVQHLKEKSAGRLRSRQCRPIILKDGQQLDLDDF